MVSEKRSVQSVDANAAGAQGSGVSSTEPNADADAHTPKQKPSGLREIIETALLALLIFLLVRTFVLNFKVDGRSMMPTFENGEMLLVNRNAYRSLDAWDFIDWIPGMDDRNTATIIDFGDPVRGDVVVFTPPPPGEDKPYIKRVIGLPGDEVEVHDNNVYVNGAKLDEEYVDGKYSTCPAGEDPWQYCGQGVVIQVPEDHVYVMGDNRTNSQDSRYFGPVPEENIIGKAWVVYWPLDVFGTVPHASYPELDED